MAVIAAGPIFNFILAFVFSFCDSYPGRGSIFRSQGTSEECLHRRAGLQEGDVITKLDGRKIHLSRDLHVPHVFRTGSGCRWNINGTIELCLWTDGTYGDPAGA